MAPPTYEELETRVRRWTIVGDAASALQWDQEVMMPSGGTPARSQQLSTLRALAHDVLTADATGRLLDELEDRELADDRAAVVREVRREHDRAVRVPRELVEDVARTRSEALPAWKAAKAKDDFDRFAPHLRELVELKRERARRIDPDADPYEVLFQDHEPYLPLEAASRILDTLREALVPLLEGIRASDADLATDLLDGTFPADQQEALAREVLDDLGYPWDHGRLDTAPHPFSTGTPHDARITTRFDEAAPLSSLLSTVHEFGHATYTLGLPRDAYGTPLGQARDLTVHESQSRLWENHVARSEPFLERLLPRLAARFPSLEDATVRELHQAANLVEDGNLIRVDADELTYHLHIVARFEIERELVGGDLDVDEVPARWNELYEDVLGLVPPTDTEGCLQDIHWSHGSFGYFPTYSLGSVLAAQLFDALRDDVPHVDARIREGDFDVLRDWLGERVHRHGQRYPTDELVERATGKRLEADAFLDHAERKFGALYDL